MRRVHTARRAAGSLAAIALLAVALLLAAPSAASAQESPHATPSAETSVCGTCHTSHIASPAPEASSGPDSACLSCHAVAVTDADTGTGHDLGPGGDMQCSSCHSPHKTSADARYRDPDDRTRLLSSPMRRVVDADGAVYVLVGAAHDGLAPAISGIALDSRSDGTAPTITWSTGEAASSWVDWGITSAYESGNASAGTPFGSGELVTSHRVQLSGLIPGTTYHYRVRSADALGNVSVSGDRTFTAFETPPEEYDAPASMALAAETPLYEDEFDGPLDTSTWQPVTPFNTRFVPGQLQWYDPANLLFANGSLRILTERRPMNGYEYVSGIITSLSRSQFSHGYFEVRAKLPAGRGAWPAAWLTNDRSQEIDIVELLGERPTRMYMSYEHQGSQVYQEHFEGPDFSEDYHTFGMDWQPEYIRWYVDGVLRAEYRGAIPSDPMWLVINTAVGGRAGDPDSTTPFPQAYDLDYVRVYERMPAGSVTGSPSSSIASGTQSVYTDRIALEVTEGSSHTLQPAAIWGSAGPESSKPTPSSPGSLLDGAELAKVASADGEYLVTHEASADREWNWQLVRFDSAAAADVISSLRVTWNGRGEPTAGYPTALYLWEDDAWMTLATREAGTDTAMSAERRSVSAEFCLTCHDDAMPAGVSRPEGMTDIRAAWEADVHGGGVGEGFGASDVAAPYTRSGSVECATCHDPHGSGNILHVPAQVNGQTVAATGGSQIRSLCTSCHQGTIDDWHAPCVECHRTGHWAGWVDPPVESYLPAPDSDCTSCHGHGASWTHPETCTRCHGSTELKALGATPDAPWTYERTF